MAFNSDIRQFATVLELATYLARLPKPTWGVRGSTYHNTYIPTAAQWAGRRSMLSMQATYVKKGWTAGPHFFLCLGAPNPAHDGIWQMTPPSSPGVHAGDCNSTRWGVEVVGDYDTVAPPSLLQQLLVDTLAVLHRWAGIGPNLVAHRDCMPGRTCPGRAFYAVRPALIGGVAAQLATPATPPTTRYRVVAPTYISETPSPYGPVALRGAAVLYPGEIIIARSEKDGWVHLANQVGFVALGGLEKA